MQLSLFTALDNVNSEIMFMDQSCKGMSTKLTVVKARTHQLMSQMTNFQSFKYIPTDWVIITKFVVSVIVYYSNQLGMEQNIVEKMMETLQLW